MNYQFNHYLDTNSILNDILEIVVINSSVRYLKECLIITALEFIKCVTNCISSISCIFLNMSSICRQY